MQGTSIITLLHANAHMCVCSVLSTGQQQVAASSQCVALIYTCVCVLFLLQGSNKMQLGMSVLQDDPNMQGEAWNEVSDEAKEVIS